MAHDRRIGCVGGHLVTGWLVAGCFSCWEMAGAACVNGGRQEKPCRAWSKRENKEKEEEEREKGGGDSSAMWRTLMQS